MNVKYFDLLGGEPIYIDKVGHVKPPLLQDIKKKLGYENYNLFCSLLALDLETYLNVTELKERYDELSDGAKEYNTFYNLITHSEQYREMYLNIFSFFMVENVMFDIDSNMFVVWDMQFNAESQQEEETIVGLINQDNFETVRDVLLQVNGLKQLEEKPVKYKNERARLLAEKIKKHEEEKALKSQKGSLDLGQRISKFCADNKNGINILNVWDMTIFQFYDQWSQHNFIRQTAIQDMVYANTVSFSDLKAYDSQLWLKNIID